MAAAILSSREEIHRANDEDIAKAKEDGISPSLLHRLEFTDEKVATAVKGVRELAMLPDPIGRTLVKRELDPGFVLEKRTFPIGVIAMIFEARPDALVQMAGLCLRSGNTVVLKGGREALNTNRVLCRIILEATAEAVGCAWLLGIENRADVDALLSMEGLIDLIIPRGSNSFVRHVMDNTRIPVLGHADGIQHREAFAGHVYPTGLFHFAQHRHIEVGNAHSHKRVLHISLQPPSQHIRKLATRQALHLEPPQNGEDYLSAVGHLICLHHGGGVDHRLPCRLIARQWHVEHRHRFGIYPRDIYLQLVVGSYDRHIIHHPERIGAVLSQILKIGHGVDRSPARHKRQKEQTCREQLRLPCPIPLSTLHTIPLNVLQKNKIMLIVL